MKRGYEALQRRRAGALARLRKTLKRGHESFCPSLDLPENPCSCDFKQDKPRIEAEIKTLEARLGTSGGGNHAKTQEQTTN